MQDLLVGLLLVAVGTAFCLWGFVAMRLIIPLWGALAGFVVGAGAVANLTSEGFLGTMVGWIAGLILALVFGLLAYIYYEISVFLALAGIGFSLGTSVMVALGIEWSWLLILVGIACGAGLGFLAIVTDLPMLLLVLLTALGGAAVVVAGLMLVFGTVDLGQFASASTTERLDDAWWWYAIYVAAAAAGVAIQVRSGGWPRGGLRAAWSDAGGRQFQAD